jgi:hypothetical protein
MSSSAEMDVDGRVEEPKTTPGVKLISSYYTRTLRLKHFLKELVQDVALIEPEDDEEYQTLVRESWVGLDSLVEGRRVFDNHPASQPQCDVSCGLLFVLQFS